MDDEVFTDFERMDEVLSKNSEENADEEDQQTENKSQAYIAASLRPATRAKGLSLGDRACLALAIERGVPALTADRAWMELDVGVDVRLIR